MPGLPIGFSSREKQLIAAAAVALAPLTLVAAAAAGSRVAFNHVSQNRAKFSLEKFADANSRSCFISNVGSSAVPLSEGAGSLLTALAGAAATTPSFNSMRCVGMALCAVDDFVGAVHLFAASLSYVVDDGNGMVASELMHDDIATTYFSSARALRN